MPKSTTLVDMTGQNGIELDYSQSLFPLKHYPLATLLSIRPRPYYATTLA